MTNREFYNAIIATVDNEELVAFAKSAVSKLNARNAKRASKPSKTALANVPVRNAIYAYVTEHPQAIASEIATALEISTAKASALCVGFVNEGKFLSVDKKVPKRGKVKAYSLADNEGEVIDEEIVEESEEA